MNCVVCCHGDSKDRAPDTQLQREVAIPIDKALPIAKQTAEALESAHEHRNIHPNQNARYAWRSKGLRQSTPVHITSRTLRVTKVMSWT